MDALITSNGERNLNQATNKVAQYNDSKTEMSDTLKASDVVMVGCVEPPFGVLVSRGLWPVINLSLGEYRYRQLHC